MPLLSLNTFVQVMFGVGTPSAVQDNVTSVPSSTRTWLLGSGAFSDGGSVETGNL